MTCSTSDRGGGESRGATGKERRAGKGQDGEGVVGRVDRKDGGGEGADDNDEGEMGRGQWGGRQWGGGQWVRGDWDGGMGMGRRRWGCRLREGGDGEEAKGRGRRRGKRRGISQKEPCFTEEQKHKHLLRSRLYIRDQRKLFRECLEDWVFGKYRDFANAHIITPQFQPNRGSNPDLQIMNSTFYVTEVLCSQQSFCKVCGCYIKTPLTQ